VDRGVPALVAKDAPDKKVVGIAFEEVGADAKEPAGYEEDWGKGPLPFDFVVFTPKTKREDPCAGLRKRMEKERAAKKNAAPEAAGAAPGAAKPAAP